MSNPSKQKPEPHDTLLNFTPTDLGETQGVHMYTR